MLGVAVAAAAIAATALLSATAGASPKTTKLTKVTLQLKWVTQAQFAGYYAAQQQGYYKEAGLDVNIKVGGPNITPEQVVVGGGADIGLDWLPNLLREPREGRRARLGRAGLRPQRHDGAHVEVERDQHDQEDGGQDGRRLVLREPAGAVRGAEEERHRPEQLEGRHDLQPAVRHERVPQQARSTLRRR